MIALTAGYFDVEAASAATSVLKLAVDCAPKEVKAAAAVVAPVPPALIGKVPEVIAVVLVVYNAPPFV